MRQLEKVSISDSLAGLLKQMSKTQLRQVREMFTFYYTQYKDLRKSSNAESVAVAVHNSVDYEMSELERKGEEIVTCAKGCSFCCYLQVDITDDEATLLTNYAEEEKIDIDYKHLESQLEGKDFLKLPFQTRKCNFLDKDGNCKVYLHRPSACRKLVVISEPKLCDTVNSKGATVGRLASVEAEVQTSASLNARQSGVMAKMLLNKKNGGLQNKGE